MTFLYGKTVTKTDVYRFQVNQGGDLLINFGQGNHFVYIVFENGKFKNCKLLFEISERQHWHILGEICEKIAEIEKSYQEVK